jgi:hypothetical protein
MGENFLICSSPQDVIPELATFFFRPRVSPLIDGNDELGGLSNKVEELGFGGFHLDIPAKMAIGLSLYNSPQRVNRNTCHIMNFLC